MLKMVAAVDSLRQFGMVAPQDKPCAAKTGAVSDEASQLGDTRPADEVEVNFIKQRPDPRSHPPRMPRSCPLDPALLSPGRVEVGFHRVEREDGAIHLGVLHGDERRLKGFRYFEGPNHRPRDVMQDLRWTWRSNLRIRQLVLPLQMRRYPPNARFSRRRERSEPRTAATGSSAVQDSCGNVHSPSTARTLLSHEPSQFPLSGA